MPSTSRKTCIKVVRLGAARFEPLECLLKQFFSLSLLTSLIALFLLPANLAQEELAQRAQVRAWIEGSLLQGDLLHSLSFDGTPHVAETAPGWRRLLRPARSRADDDQEVLVEPSA